MAESVQSEARDVVMILIARIVCSECYTDAYPKRHAVNQTTQSRTDTVCSNLLVRPKQKKKKKNLFSAQKPNTKMNKHVNKVRKATGRAKAITAGRQQNKQHYLIIQLMEKKNKGNN